MIQGADPEFRHNTPDDIAAGLAADGGLRARWNALTPLGRNEWICWTISAQKADIRAKRLARLQEGGGRRQEASMLLAWLSPPTRKRTQMGGRLKTGPDA
ncbi:YdeI/OmpD-associated family protein [Erythrobacter sp. SDW2]|uniref:YdeI/OmpD-associated family protein n=1 Tax=Erythrobacter sp. SDW2 TaxID=2907154 RepID=UPI001F3505D8|nr:YdeI/OmpD-associated family protein [Erythrobacter sp. SDW2]UIP06033.1 YdeI/OmpD-associated family protein [Erythrobacter sp. SDW2]